MPDDSMRQTARTVDGVSTARSDTRPTPNADLRSTAVTPHRPVQDIEPPQRTARQDARRARIQKRGAQFARTQTGAPVGVGGKNTETNYRIKGMSKFAMLLVALLLDLLPLIAVVGVAAVVMGQTGLNASTLEACANTKHVALTVILGAWWNIDASHCVLGGGVGLAAGLATLFWLGPVIYLIASFLAMILAPLIFFLWFTVKHVPYFSSKGGRMQVLLTAALIESIPFLNIVPGITFSTWKLVRISRIEDKEKVKNPATMQA